MRSHRQPVATHGKVRVSGRFPASQPGGSACVVGDELARDGENRPVRLAEARDEVGLGLEGVAVERGELLDRELEALPSGAGPPEAGRPIVLENDARAGDCTEGPLTDVGVGDEDGSVLLLVEWFDGRKDP